MCRSRRLISVIRKLTPKKPTQTTAIAMSIGHSSSAYSLLCVIPSGKRDRGGNDDHLPAPKMQPAQRVAPHPGFAQPLRAVIDRRENRVAGERKNRRVGVQRTQSTKTEPFQAAKQAAASPTRSATINPASVATSPQINVAVANFADDVIVVRKRLHHIIARSLRIKFVFPCRVCRHYAILVHYRRSFLSPRKSCGSAQSNNLGAKITCNRCDTLTQQSDRS